MTTVSDKIATTAGDGYYASATSAFKRDDQVLTYDVTDTSYTDQPGDGEHTYRVGVVT